jgi:peptide/nickel transport system substrate-binding protein
MLQTNLAMETLDPSTNQFVSVGASFFNEIYGSLFVEEPNGEIGLGMAQSEQFSNHNEKFSFTIRSGIKFTDGTSYNAPAVVYNIKRDLAAGCLTYGTCDQLFTGVTSITAKNSSTVVMTMSTPEPGLAAAFINDPPDWIGSPAAIASEGPQTFGEHPVGAGPYILSSFTPNTSVVINKNPHYYIKGEPYLDQITFLQNTVDESAYASLQSNAVQMVIGFTTPSIIESAKSQFNVKLFKSPMVSFLDLNTYDAPFSNPLAREAVADAISEPETIDLVEPGYATSVEDTAGPGSPEYERSVPGYRKYDLTKAQSLVQQLGGLSFTLLGGTTPIATLEVSAIQSELAQANIQVKIDQVSTAIAKGDLLAGTWSAIPETMGGVDPDVGPFSILEYLKSGGIYTCCRDASLDGLINKTIQFANPATAAKLFQQINELVLDQSDIVPLYSVPEDIIADRSIGGIVAAPNVNSLQMWIQFTTMYLK